MSTLLIKNTSLLVTMDDAQREIPGGGLFIRDGFIEQVGPDDQLPSEADQVLDLDGCLLLPGLVNLRWVIVFVFIVLLSASDNSDSGRG